MTESLKSERTIADIVFYADICEILINEGPTQVLGIGESERYNHKCRGGNRNGLLLLRLFFECKYIECCKEGKWNTSEAAKIPQEKATHR